MSWGAVRSACPRCKTCLGFYDLVPFFSWALFRGRCRHCKNPVSIRYPLIEVLSMCTCLGVYVTLGLSVESLFLIFAVPFLIALVVIDLERMILPDILVFIVMIIGVFRLFYFSVSGVFNSAGELFLPYVMGAFVYCAFSWVLSLLMGWFLKKEAMGFGDVKFFFVAGLWLGLGFLPYFLILSGVVAILFALFWRLIFKTEIFPFGPALILSFYMILLFQGRFIS